MPSIAGKDRAAVLQFISATFKQARIKLLDPIPQSVEQQGHAGKLYALSAAMNTLFAKDPAHRLEEPPAPARKRDDRKNGLPSLREVAKKADWTQIGEIDHHETLIKLAAIHGYSCETLTTSTDDYIETLIATIDNEEAPIVFFDVNNQTGEPQLASSHYEHAAVVAGYFHDGSKTHFIIAQWGQYFYVNAASLRESANQLSTHQQETFYKIDKKWRQIGDCLDFDNKLKEKIKSNKFKEVHTNPPQHAGASFRNKILIVKIPKSAQELKIPEAVSINQAIPLSVEYQYKKFIRLDELINFIEVDMMRTAPFSEVDIASLLADFDFEDSLVRLTTKEFNTIVDGTLEDDIYKQNPRRTRSLTEKITNSIDANSKIIQVVITHGKYSVKDVGVGMTPVIIFRKLLLPKSTSKEDSMDSIGQFGLGFYTTLAHLTTRDDVVTVHTKAEGFDGYTIEFRSFNNKIYVHTTANPDLIKAGTEVIVQSDQIEQQAFERAVFENFEHHRGAPIIVNQHEINNVVAADSIVKEVSHSQVKVDAKASNKYSAITIKGILIQKIVHDQNTNCMQVVWDLNKRVFFISEARNQVRITSDAARNELRALIDFSDTLQPADRIRYLNTIAELVHCLQMNNSSMLVEHDVLQYLRAKIQRCCDTLSMIPNYPELAALSTDRSALVHPLLMPHEWQLKLGGFKTKKWQGHCPVWVVPMKPGDTKLIYHEKGNAIYLDKSYYTAIAHEKEWWKLSLSFSLLPGELNGQWDFDYNEEDNNSNLPWLTPDEPSHNPREPFYRRHSVLFDYGDAFTDSLRDKVETLGKAETLMRVYPAQAIQLFDDRSPHEGPMREFYFIKRIYHRNTLYYFAKINNWSSQAAYAIFNDGFGQLLDFRSLLLLAKATQLYESDSLELDIELTKEDRLLLRCRLDNCSRIYDGEGNVCIRESLPYDLSMRVLNKEYYVVSYWFEFISRLFTHKNEQIAFIEGARLEVITKSPLIVGYMRDSKKQYSHVYHVNGRRYLIDDPEAILLHYSSDANTFVFLKKIYSTVTKYNFQEEERIDYQLIVVNRQGLVLFAHQFDAEQFHDKIVRANIKIVNSLMLIKLSLEREGSYIPVSLRNILIVVRSKDDYDVRNLNEHAPNPFIGYFTNALWFTFTNSQRHLLIDNRKSFAMSSITLEAEAILVDADEALGIICCDDLVPLPNVFSFNDVKDIRYDYGYLILTIKRDDGEWQFLMNLSGKILLADITISVVKTKNSIFFIKNNTYIVNEKMTVIYENALIDYVSNEKQNYLKVTLKDKGGCDLIDYTGRSVIGGLSHSVYVTENYFTFDAEPKVRVFVTHHSRFRGQNVSTACGPHAKHKPLLTTGNSSESRVFDMDGHSLFTGTLNTPYLVGDHIIVDKRFMLAPLTTTQLFSQNTHLILQFLNQRQLNAVDYGLCLRFVDLNHKEFVTAFPFLKALVYVPRENQRQHYEQFIQRIMYFPVDVAKTLMRMVDLIYSIAGSYSSLNFTDKIFKLYELFGIYSIEMIIKDLSDNKNNAKLLLHLRHGVIKRELFDDTKQTVGHFLYYLFSDANNLLEPCTELKVPDSQRASAPLSMIDLITVFRMNAKIADTYTNKKEFFAHVTALANGVDKHHIYRKLTHALYHQAQPNKSLYLREFIQNALDAYAEMPEQRNRQIETTISKNEDEECVLTLSDQGVGMTIKTLINYFLNPGMSSKRAQPGVYIGGRGVGLFTAYPGAKCIMVKTGDGINDSHIMSLTPQYMQSPSGELQVEDILIDWTPTSEKFAGTTIQRISFGQEAMLEAAKYHRAVATHAKFIDQGYCSVTVNGNIVNKALSLLARVTIPKLGEVKIYKSSEAAITVGGLYLKPYRSILFSNLPWFVQSIFENHELVLDLPKQTRLNRERNDFEDVDKVETLLFSHLTQGLYAAYFRLFVKGHVKFNELPYDFFQDFLRYQAKSLLRNPDLLNDAAMINAGSMLQDYSRYQNTQLLWDLMSHLKIIEYLNKNNEIQKLSLVAMANKYRANDLIEENCPPVIRRLIDFDRESKRIVAQCTRRLENFPGHEKAWQINSESGKAANFQFFIALCNKLTAKLVAYPVESCFSLIHKGALAYVVTQSKKKNIYWNPLAIYHSNQLSVLVKQSSNSMSKESFIKAITALLNPLSHELTHLNDAHDACTGTHNRAFFIRQRSLLMQALPNISSNNLYQDYCEYHASVKDTELPDDMNFIEMSLNTKVPEKQKDALALIKYTGPLIWNKRREPLQTESPSNAVSSSKKF